MIIKYERSFLKDLKKVEDQKLRIEVLQLIAQIKSANSLQDIKNVQKIKGSPSAFRIRLGDYRLGFFLEKQSVILSRVLHRKDIYKYFP